MNQLITSSTPMTMSSREIAELCDKRHDNVKRTIEALLNQGVIVRPQIEDESGADAMGRQRITQVYVFTGERGKRDCIIVVAQLCPEFTARIVDRWQELEEKASQPRELSRLELLQMAIDSEQGRLAAEQKNLLLEHKVIELAPKAAAHDMLAISDGDLCITDAAKALGVQQRKFTSYLIHIGWAYRRQSNGKLVGHAASEKRGLITHRPVPIHHSNGEVETVLQPLITPKGLAKLAEMLATGESA